MCVYSTLQFFELFYSIFLSSPPNLHQSIFVVVLLRFSLNRKDFFSVSELSFLSFSYFEKLLSTDAVTRSDIQKKFQKYLNWGTLVWARPQPIMLKILAIMLLSIAQKSSLLCSKSSPLCSKLYFQNQDYASEPIVYKNRPYYASIMPDAFCYLLCFKLCRHNRPGPSLSISFVDERSYNCDDMSVLIFEILHHLEIALFKVIHTGEVIYWWSNILKECLPLLERSEESNTTSCEPKWLEIFIFKVETKGIPTLPWKNLMLFLTEIVSSNFKLFSMSHNANNQLAPGVYVASTKEDMTVTSNFSVCMVLLSFATWGNT